MAHSVLITGTTSGLGLALLEQYVSMDWKVIAVNRRTAADIEHRFPGVRFLLADITNEEEILALCRGVEAPELLILNAGINREDNNTGIELTPFREVLDINLYGTLSFIHAAQALDWKATIVGISSTSTIVPNSRNLGYLVSKAAIRDLFRLLSRADTARRYKVIILGPVETNLNRGLPPQQGLQKKIFDALSLSAKDAAARCIRFIEGNARVSYPPLPTCLFYTALKLFLILKPGFYYKPYRQ